MEVVITFSGQHGTGKSTYARQIATRLGLKYISAGSLFREMASEKGLSLTAFSRMCERDEGIDRMIDRRSIDSMKGGNVLIDSKLAGHFAREFHAFKVCLTAPLEVRLERIAKRDGKPVDEVREETLERESSERSRFKKYYDFNVDDLFIYDLVLNTALMSLRSNLSILECASRSYIESRG
jgi:cytidylate kinase